jgi:hypothetical protein
LSNGGRGGLFPEGKAQVQELVKFYLQNATIIREKLTAAGLEVHGGVNAPYVWVKTPRVYQVGISSINCYIPVMWWEPRIWLWAAREVISGYRLLIVVPTSRPLWRELSVNFKANRQERDVCGSIPQHPIGN